MQEAQTHPGAEPPVDAVPVEAAVRAGIADTYQLQALQHLRDRGMLNAMMIGLLDGTRAGTIEEFEALSHAHEALTREAGAALMCLGAVMGSEGAA